MKKTIDRLYALAPPGGVVSVLPGAENGPPVIRMVAPAGKKFANGARQATIDVGLFFGDAEMPPECASAELEGAVQFWFESLNA